MCNAPGLVDLPEPRSPRLLSALSAIMLFLTGSLAQKLNQPQAQFRQPLPSFCPQIVRIPEGAPIRS